MCTCEHVTTGCGPHEYQLLATGFTVYQSVGRSVNITAKTTDHVHWGIAQTKFNKQTLRDKRIVETVGSSISIYVANKTFDGIEVYGSLARNGTVVDYGELVHITIGGNEMKCTFCFGECDKGLMHRSAIC